MSAVRDEWTSSQRESGPRRALWIVTAGIQKLASGSEPEQRVLECGIASARLRTAVAALEWKRAGNTNIFWHPGAGGSTQGIDWASADVCIVPKFYFNEAPEPWHQACLAARNSRCPLVIDVTDFPFASEYDVIRAFYFEALKICDAVVVNSERMAEFIAPHVSRTPVVIEDAILGMMRNPEFAPAGRLRLLWFGHATNLRYLNAWLDRLRRFAMQKPCRLTVVTESGSGAREVIQNIDARCAPALEARFVEWSLEAMAAALRRCDIVIIPSDPSDPFKAGVSANRIAEALKAGRFPVASPLPSYLPFAEAAWLGADLIEGIKWALANPAEVRARIRRGQSLVSEKFAPERIGRQWRELFEKLVNSSGT
jgi:glycosyltransferase involved in cell wall biosynthesis